MSCDSTASRPRRFSLPAESGPDFDKLFIGHFAWSPGGRRIAMARFSFSSDVVLLRNLR